MSNITRLPEIAHLPDTVLIHGLKESGKSTLAERLMTSFGYVRVKMAGPLKNMLRSLLRDAGVDESLIEDYVEGHLKEVPIPQLSNRSSRQLMQTLGDEWRKMQADDFWIDIAIGTKHFDPIEPTRHPGERPLPVYLFDAHIANDFVEKGPYWALAEQCLRDWSALEQAHIDLGVRKAQSGFLLAA
jgi:hypothetical protein